MRRDVTQVAVRFPYSATSVDPFRAAARGGSRTTTSPNRGRVSAVTCAWRRQGEDPLQSEELNAVAARLDATPMAVALAWLPQRAPNILLIPGTSSVAHLRENVAAAALTLPDDALAELDVIA
jgi:aryl-alcohol dehydrogenase-like predicted oxidoreductase